MIRNDAPYAFYLPEDPVTRWWRARSTASGSSDTSAGTTKRSELFCPLGRRRPRRRSRSATAAGSSKARGTARTLCSAAACSFEPAGPRAARARGDQLRHTSTMCSPPASSTTQPFPVQLYRDVETRSIPGQPRSTQRIRRVRAHRPRRPPAARDHLARRRRSAGCPLHRGGFPNCRVDHVRRAV